MSNDREGRSVSKKRKIDDVIDSIKGQIESNKKVMTETSRVIQETREIFQSATKKIEETQKTVQSYVNMSQFKPTASLIIQRYSGGSIDYFLIPNVELTEEQHKAFQHTTTVHMSDPREPMVFKSDIPTEGVMSLEETKLYNRAEDVLEEIKENHPDEYDYTPGTDLNGVLITNVYSWMVY